MLALRASMAEREPQPFTCCNTRIDALPFADAVAALCNGSTGGRAVHLCNAYTLSLTARDPELAACISRGDLNLPDGMPLVWVARRLGIALPSRVYGPDLMAETLDAGRETGLRHYLYGSTPEVIGQLTEQIRRRWPGACIVGAEPDTFRPMTAAEEDELVERVRAARPDVVWVGLGTPKQDEFVDRYRDRLGTTLVAVGAAFDFHAGTLRQAPAWIRERGLEWLYRFAAEPRRLWRRYLFGNTIFLFHTALRPPKRVRTDARLRGVLLVAGPDGSGKTTVADRLQELAEDAGTQVERAHWRPGVVLGRPGDGSPVTEPHAQPPRSGLASTAKLLLATVDVWLAFLGPWRRARRDGLVIWERGWHDQIVDPARYRLQPEVVERLAWMRHLIPRSDAVLLVQGDPDAIHARKPELPAQEIKEQVTRWAQLANAAGRHVVHVDTVQSGPSEAASQAMSGLVPVGGSGPAASSAPWRSVWPTPSRVGLSAAGGGGATPALAIYRPHRASSRSAVAAARLLHRFGLGLSATPPPPEILAFIDELAPGADGWAAMRSSYPGRFVIAAARHGKLEAFVKVGPPTDDALEREATTLKTIGEADLGLTVPRIRRWGMCGTWHVLAVEPLDLRKDEVPDELVLGEAIALFHAGWVHGDFAPWNVLWTDRGIALIDWEAAEQASRPLHDLAHFVVQRGGLAGRYPAERAVDLLTRPGSLGARYLDAIGIDPREAGPLVRQYLVAAPDTDNASLLAYRESVEQLLR